MGKKVNIGGLEVVVESVEKIQASGCPIVAVTKKTFESKRAIFPSGTHGGFFCSLWTFGFDVASDYCPVVET